MLRTRLLLLSCLAVGLLSRVGLVDDRVANSSGNEAGPRWSLSLDDSYVPAVARAVSPDTDSEQAILVTPERAIGSVPANQPRPRWSLDSAETRYVPAYVKAPADEVNRRLSLILADPPVDVPAKPPLEDSRPQWTLDVDNLGNVPVITVSTSISAQSGLAILTETENDQSGVFMVGDPKTLWDLKQDDTSLVTLSVEADGTQPGTTVVAEDIAESQFAISMVEPLDLQAIRLAALQSNHQINVFRFQQEAVATGIDTAEARFDPTFGIGIFGGGADRQNRSLIQSLGVNTLVQDSYFLNPYEQNQIYLEKRTRIGGKGTIGFTSEYLSVDPADLNVFVNPGFDSRLRFTYEQSLLKGFGREVNEAPIYVAARLADQSSFIFQAAVQRLMRDVELAYWDWELAHSLQQLLDADEERSRVLWVEESERLRIGTGTAASEAQSRERYHRSRIRLIQGDSLTTIGELKLRLVAGLPAVAGLAFVPDDPAEAERYYDDLFVSIGNSYRRPEVQAQQAAIAAADAQTVVAENGLKPDLSLILDYSMLGLEERFDDSLSTLGDFKFNEWTVGVRYTQPLYWRAERAGVRRAQWTVARQQAIMDQLQHTISHEVANAFEQVRATGVSLEVHEDRILAAELDVEARGELYKNRRGSLNLLIDAQDRLLEARTEFRVALTNHQKAISLLNYASGMILEGQVIIQDQGVPVPGTPVPGTDVPPAPADEAQGADSDAANLST